jgi:hypothetical protein
MSKGFEFINIRYADFFDTFDRASVVYDLDLSSMTWGDSSVSLFSADHVLREIERHDSDEAKKLAEEIRSFIEDWGGETLIGF